MSATTEHSMKRELWEIDVNIFWRKVSQFIVILNFDNNIFDFGADLKSKSILNPKCFQQQHIVYHRTLLEIHENSLM